MYSFAFWLCWQSHAQAVRLKRWVRALRDAPGHRLCLRFGGRMPDARPAATGSGAPRGLALLERDMKVVSDLRRLLGDGGLASWPTSSVFRTPTSRRRESKLLSRSTALTTTASGAAFSSRGSGSTDD